MPTTYFPYELDRLTFSKQTGDTDINLILDGSSILSTTLTPNDKGQIVLTDIGRYIADRVEQARKASSNPNAFVKQTLEVRVGEAKVAAYTLRPCRSRMRATAEKLLPTMFLTMASGGTKYVPLTAESESAYLLSDDTTGAYNFTLTAYWINLQTRQLQTTTYEWGGNANPGQIVRIDLTPSNQTPPDASGQWQLVRTDVTSGERTIKIQTPPDGLAQAPVTTLQFVNSFGIIDTFYILGQLEREIKPTYSAALIEGRQTNYLIESNPTYKATTGPLTDATIALLHDLATSTEVTHEGRAITLTSIDLKPSNAYSDQQKATISWRETTEGGSVEPDRPKGTFDATFDATFDRTT